MILIVIVLTTEQTEHEQLPESTTQASVPGHCFVLAMPLFPGSLCHRERGEETIP